MKYLQTLGVKTLIVSNILKVDFKESDGKEEFKTLAPSFSTLDDFKTFLAEANKEGWYPVLTLLWPLYTMHQAMIGQGIGH